MSYIYSLVHVVITTYKREKTLVEVTKKDLYRYIWGIIKNRRCVLVRINGIEDHIHILMELRSDVALAQLVAAIKRSSSIWLKETKLMPTFKGWENGYAAFTCSFGTKEKISSYIINQENHHKTESSDDEFVRLLGEHGLKKNDFD